MTNFLCTKDSFLHVVTTVFFQDLLYRRTRALADYENANKALDKARLKGKDVKLAEAHQQGCCQRFEKLSESAKQGKATSRVHGAFYVESLTYRICRAPAGNGCGGDEVLYQRASF